MSSIIRRHRTYSPVNMKAIMAIPAIFLILQIISSSKVSSLKTERDSFTDLDNNNIQNLDTMVRKKLLFMILERLNETVRDQNNIAGQCEIKLSSAVQSCQHCSGSLCTSNTAINIPAVMNQLIPVVYEPVLVLGNFVGGMASSIGTVPALLGTDHGLFYGLLGQLATTVGTGLDNSANSILSGASTVLSSLGKGLEGVGSQLIGLGGNALLQTANTAGNLLNTIGLTGANLLTQTGSGLGNLVSGLQQSVNQLGSDLGHAGQNLVSSTGNALTGLVHGATNILSQILGRREIPSKRTCLTQCPACDTVDTQIHSHFDIIKSVCGQTDHQQQQDALSFINRLKSLYNTTLTSHIVERVIYDPSSIQTSGGVSFLNSFVTALTDAGLETFKLDGKLSLTDLPSVANSLATKIWQLWN